MDVVGQHDPRDDLERMPLPHPRNDFAQGVDAFDKQAARAIGEVNRAVFSGGSNS
ncbi:MAG: hypothetical protein ACREP0_06185 [Rhodanobacteraceae bacterium]